MISFRLTMPNIGSWNGNWSGNEDMFYIIKRTGRKKEEELAGRNFYYDFEDGWGARVRVEKIDSKEANRRRRVSKGFCDCGWMITEILKYGKILTKKERQVLRDSGKYD